MAAIEISSIPSKNEEDLTEDTAIVDEKETSSITKDGALDRKGKPAVKSRTGTWKSALLLLVNYGLVTFAFFGLGVNLVLFLTRVIQQENADAANNVSKWTGTVYIFSLLGAFLSDSYWGRYLTCVIFQLIFILGLILLSLSSWILLVKPLGCRDGKLECSPVSALGTAMFYLSIYLIALGNGGYQPNIATFGSDQFDEQDLLERDSKVAFFSYFYVALNAGSLFSNTILAYYEDSGQWVLGFWISVCAAVIALLFFLLGTPRYRHFKPSGNPLTRIAQVFSAASRKWGVSVPPNDDMLYEVEGKESAIAGSRKISHSHGFRFLDKAATVTTTEARPENMSPWHLCTVTQVEEVKCVLRILPIWLCTIIYSVVFTQMASLFVEQGAVMNSRLGSFRIPPASMSAFDVVSVIVSIFLLRKILMPAAEKLGRKDISCFSELRRMGIGLVIGMLAMIAAGVVELARLRRLTSGSSSLSIMWQIPQYVLIGASEVFMYIGQLEFFVGQAPDGIKSFGSSLNMASISLGNYVSIIIVSAVMAATARGERPGWIPGDLNSGHLDRFFFLLAALVAVNFGFFVACARWYKCIRLEGSDEGGGKERKVAAMA